MYNPLLIRNRPGDSAGANVKLLFEGRMTVSSGALTTVAAATATAGHLFCMRWTAATANTLAMIRYVQLNWVMTTAFGSAQNMGWDMIVARSFSASYTGGNAIDMGSTVANTGATRTNNGTSLFAANTCRMGSTGALTAGTQTLDANAYSSYQAYMGTTLGTGASASATLLDARDDGGLSVVRSPITLAANEGIVLRNLVLMGASGVGTLMVTVEWDEVLPLS